MNPKISIIVPVYNVENILRYCVDSILRQSFSDFEVLLIDDGSKDNSGSLCDELQLQDSRIKVFHKKNGGLSDARNFGIEHASGDFYLFIDSDDVLHKDFCKVLIELQSKYNAEIVSTDLVNFFDFSEIEMLDSKVYEQQEIVYNSVGILREYFNPKDKRKIYHGLCMKLYNRELFNDLRFEKGRFHEDLFITYKLLDQCTNFVFVNLPYYYYYQKNANSITKNYKEKNLLDEFDALTFMMNYFGNNTEIMNYLNSFIINHLEYLYERTYYIKNSSVTLIKRKEIKEIIFEKMKVCSEITLKQKFEISMKIRFFFFYRYLSAFKNRINHVKKIFK